MIGKLLQAGLLTCAFMVAAAAQAMGQTVEQFYKGKTIEVIIGYATGGGNDLFGRAVANHMGKHIPGNPTLVVQNVPGAGTFVATNRVFNSSKRDGTVLALAAPTIALDEKLASEGVRFKTAELNWIGRITSRSNHVMMWKTSPVKTIQDAMAQESILAATYPSSTVAIYPNVLNNVIGTKFKLVMGYAGSNEAMLAMERGEAEGHSTTFEGVKRAHPDWLKNKDVNIIVQFGFKRDAEMPDVPTAMELARTPEQTEVLKAVLSTIEIGTSYFTAPGVPQDRVTALRRAFDATMTDPEFIAELGRVGVNVAPMTGEDLQKLVVEVANLSPELTEKVREAYVYKSDK
jgi:tripartite-type tricarboxylate transporter receptor subunit TctC